MCQGFFSIISYFHGSSRYGASEERALALRYWIEFRVQDQGLSQEFLFVWIHPDMVQ